MSKQFTKATAPKYGDIKEYITNGKTYDIIEIEKTTKIRYGYIFCIMSDRGIKCSCLERTCAHLNNLNWTLS